MGNVRWDWVIVGACSLVAGSAGGAMLASQVDGGFVRILAAALGVGVPFGLALYVLHYKQRLEERAHERLVGQCAYKLNLDAQMMRYIARTYESVGGEINEERAAYLCHEALTEIDMFKRHVLEAKVGSPELRRSVVKLNVVLTRVGSNLEDVLRKLHSKEATEDTWKQFDSSAGEIGRLTSELQKSFQFPERCLTEGEYQFRAWMMLDRN